MSLLVASIAGLAVADYRYKLAFWHDRRRAIKTILEAGSVFVIWDILGIAMGIFFRGNSKLVLPFDILPEFPPEELLFIILLCYSVLVIYTGFKKWQNI